MTAHEMRAAFSALSWRCILPDCSACDEKRRARRVLVSRAREANRWRFAGPMASAALGRYCDP